MAAAAPVLRLGSAGAAVAQALDRAQAADAARRLWAADPSLWSDDPRVQNLIANRLGWLRAPAAMRAGVDDLTAWAADLAGQLDDVVLLGMGGSSLAPEVLAAVLPRAAAAPRLTVLDSTDPAAVRRVEAALDLQRTLFVVASKSGGTIETSVLADYFWSRCQQTNGAAPSRQFAAITDPGTPLAAQARQRAYARVFLNPPDVGGRFSALSYFGLAPAALAGVDLAPVVDRALALAERSAANASAASNAPIMVGIALAGLALEGRDKLTLVPSASLRPVGAWIEQLVAESTGKQGRGIVPVDGEPLGAPVDYADDRVFVELALAGDADAHRAQTLNALASAGHPVITLPLDDRADIGAHFLLWEAAVAVAGYLLDINPFDEPNVAQSKDNTSRVLAQRQAAVRPPPPPQGPRANGVTAVDAQASSVRQALAAWLGSAAPGDYFALHAYVDRTTAADAPLRAMQAALSAAARRAVTVGYGPRFLHSTGQLHKGGPNTGVFLQITADHPRDLDAPGRGYSFGALIDAQAQGDFESLADLRRRRLRLHLDDPTTGLASLARLLADELAA